MMNFRCNFLMEYFNNLTICDFEYQVLVIVFRYIFFRKNLPSLQDFW
jgi:hypothetical protein